MGDEDFEPYEEEEVIYVDGGLPRDEYGYLGDPMYNEHRWSEATKGQLISDLERRTEAMRNMSHNYEEYLSLRE